MIMKNKIEVNVKVTYLPNQSNIPGSQYAYAYTITITILVKLAHNLELVAG